MSFGLTFEKLLLIALIAAFIIGPNRLPVYSAKLARLIRSMRQLANGAKDRVRDELGPDFDEVEWKKLDPRQYDPRRIVREALTQPLDEPEQTTSAAPTDNATAARKPATVFDPDAI